jgi:predicted nucleic acid-binding protein
VTLVDSSVWIDYFRGVASAATDLLDSLLGAEPVLVGDLILAEVLQGFRSDADFETAKRLLESLECVTLGGADIGLQAAQNFRILRGKGITVRKTIDTIIATCCIVRGYSLLYSDRDFDPFVKHLGLRSALARR